MKTVNMKRYIKSLTLVLAAVAILASCGKEEGHVNEAAGKALVLVPSMDGIARAVNYSIDDYFGLSGYDKARIC